MFAGNTTFGYIVPPENVIAMELNTSSAGIILPEYKSACVQTQRHGKVDTIIISTKQKLEKNCDPLFSAVNSSDDYEMCTSFPGMKLTLTRNRSKSGNIDKLCKQVVEEQESDEPRFILQGRNENTGIIIYCSETILFASDE